MFKHSTTTAAATTVLGMCIRQKDPRTRVLGLFFACFVEQGRAGQGKDIQKKNEGLGGREVGRVRRVKRVRGREGKVR